MGYPWAIQLVILSCGAEAVFVVWAWRYSRFLATRRARGETVDSAVELRQARWKSVTASMVRYAFLIAINVAGLRSGASLVVQSFLLFLGLAILHGQVRFAVEREIRGIEATHFDAFRLASRMLVITLAIYVVYFGVFTGVHLLAMLVTGKEAGWAAIPIGLFAALFVTYLASPILVRMMFPCKRIEDPALIETLRRCFERASLPVPTFWTLELDKHRAHNAMVAGLRSGRGILKPALFLSSSLVRELTPDEFEAVILHEVGHVQLNHMRGRMIAALASVCLSVAPIWLLGALGPYLLAPPQFAILLLGSYVLAFFIQYSAMRWTVQLQELEADSHAVIRLGADADAFSRALTKLMRMNDQLDDRKDPSSYLSAAAAHPTVVQRIEAIQQRIRRRQMGEDPFPKGEWWNRVMEDWGSPLGSVTAVLMAAALYWYVSDGRPRMELRRAAEMGDVAAIEEALDRGASVDAMDLFDGGVTPLIAAVRAGQAASVKVLLRNGADPNFITPDRLSALAEAGEKMEVRELLVAAGAKDPSPAGRALASDPVRDKH